MKPVIVGDNPAELSPRRSFAKWHQVVEGTSESWAPADLAAARLIGETLNDVVLQFRSVRVLIAKDQLDNVSRQVRNSGQAVIVSDDLGRVLLANEACVKLLGEEAPGFRRIEDLASCFNGSREIKRRVKDMINLKSTWRGEVSLRKADDAHAKPLLVRGDPVYSAPGRVLGFVLLFVDLSERKAAELERRKLQDVLIDRHRLSTVRLGSKADLVYQNLLATVAENAQLAALEICDGDDPTQMPVMLESIRTSVARAADVLQQLIWHSTEAVDDDDA